jgi:hypothetical protein
MSRTHMPKYVSRARTVGRSQAGKRFMVRALTKAGTVTRLATTASDWQLNAFSEMGPARERQAELEKLNPGKKFVIVSVAGGIVGTAPL